MSKIPTEGVAYHLQRRQCGKSYCRCAKTSNTEQWHGPYWYAYWMEKGKQQKRYIGKRLPEGVQA